MFSSQYSNLGMQSSMGASHNPPLNAWGAQSQGSLGGGLGGPTTLGDSLAQSGRGNYQSGYLLVCHFPFLLTANHDMNVCWICSRILKLPYVFSCIAYVSLSFEWHNSHLARGKIQSSPEKGAQRTDDVPIIKTNAKMNSSLLRGSTASDFGMESMFQSPKYGHLFLYSCFCCDWYTDLSSSQRRTLVDDDAPPTSSIYDIPNEMHYNEPAPRFTASKVRHISLSIHSPHARVSPGFTEHSPRAQILRPAQHRCLLHCTSQRRPSLHNRLWLPCRQVLPYSRVLQVSRRHDGCGAEYGN
jgi:hypothetical protein